MTRIPRDAAGSPGVVLELFRCQKSAAYTHPALNWVFSFVDQILIFAAQQLDDTTAVHEAAPVSANWILTSMENNRALSHIVNTGADYWNTQLA